MLSSLRSLTAFALSLFAVLALSTTASAQTPVGGLQQLPDPDDCVSTIPAPEGGEAECKVIAAGTTGATAIDVTPDGKHAYVAATGGTNTGSLATFSRNTSTGEISFNHCFAASSSAEGCPSELSLIEGASYVVATNNHVYLASADDDAVRGFTRNTTTGALTPMADNVGCVQEVGAGDCVDGDGLIGVQHLVLSPDGEFLYATSPADDSIVVLDRNTSTGGLTYVATTTQTDARAADVGGGQLYAVSESPTRTLHVYNRAGNGTLTQTECFRGTQSSPTACGAPEGAVNGLNNPQDVAVIDTGTASNVFVVSRRADMTGASGSTVARFDRDTTTGALTHQGCLRDPEATLEAACTSAEGLDDATSITPRPDGLTFYVTAYGDDAITSFTPTTGTSGGTATRIDSVTDGTETGLDGVNEAAVTDDGEFLYSAADLDHAVAEFAIQYAPVCTNITRNDIPFETTVRFPPACTDKNDRDQIFIIAVTQPEPGEGTSDAVDTNNDTKDDTLEYDPPDGYDDSTFFTYQVEDDQGNDSNTATVNVTVLPSGAPVISIADAAQSESDGSMVFTLQRSGPTATSHVVSFTTQDDTATAGQDYTATAGTVTFDAGETQETITVPLLGDNVDEVTERFRLTLTNATNNASISDNLAVGTIADDDTAVASIGNATVAEDGGPATVTVTLSNPSSRTVTITYATNEGTATSPEDYTAAAEDATVSFTPGDTSETISIPIVDDNAVEQTEQFGVTLSGPTGGAALGDANGDVSITDDEVPGITISDVGIAEGDSGTRNATFTVTLSAPTSSTVTVNYGTLNGSASSPGDYTASSGTVTFTPGATTRTVTVPIVGDTTEEPDETFSVLLSTPSNAVIADGTGVATIQNDDQAPAPPPEEPPAPQPTLVVGDTGIAEGDAGTRNAVFTVALSRASSVPVSVDVTTANGTALGGQDYLAGGGRVTFAPGETAKAVPVQVRGDIVPEPDETFTVRLSGATGADIVKAVGIGTIANDDIRRRLPGLRFTVSPRRDVTLPHVFTVTGSVRLPSGVSEAEGCGSGFISAQYKNRGNTISSRRVVLDEDCRFRIRTPFNIRSRLRNTRSLKLTVRFLGNRYLSPRRAQAVFVRIR